MICGHIDCCGIVALAVSVKRIEEAVAVSKIPPTVRAVTLKEAAGLCPRKGGELTPTVNDRVTSSAIFFHICKIRLAHASREPDITPHKECRRICNAECIRRDESHCYGGLKVSDWQ